MSIANCYISSIQCYTEVCSLNDRAAEMVGKNIGQAKGLQGGDVFECKYAKLPGGCGKTIHCSGCTIRNTVTDTLQTGNSHSQVPATLNTYQQGESVDVEFLISTEKVNNVVFLKVEPIK